VVFAAASPAANTLFGDGLRQTAELGAALVLAAAIGLEREIRQKDAGLRTHTLVGVGAALFMLISKYGFTDVLEKGLIVVDPSRVAAQIVSGIGFLGAGIIFVRRDSVRGLTTAASIWVTAAIGAAAGAGLLVLAALTTVIYFIVALLFPLLTRRIGVSANAMSALRVRYPDRRGLLRAVLQQLTERGFAIDDVSTQMISPQQPAGFAPDGDGRAPDGQTRDGRAPDGQTRDGRARDGRAPMVEVTLHVRGRQPVAEMAAILSDLDEVSAVLVRDLHSIDE
jgi:putative Mg2+ transporter-C (MgtC) family protein